VPDHEVAMEHAATEYERLLALTGQLTAGQWEAPTECPGWTVKAVVGHLAGMLARLADPAEARRQAAAAAERAARTGENLLDALTATQVAEHEELAVGALVARLGELVPAALAVRRAATPEQRREPYRTAVPGEPTWTVGYLWDVIMTRDPWLHRVDICRAAGADLILTAEHDGWLVAEVVAEWSLRHGQPYRLELTGPVGGSFGTSDGSDPTEPVRLDAVEFCRILSGRAPGDGLLATRVPF
jgi:uncharacterized protein (TIGR03083 family)